MEGEAAYSAHWGERDVGEEEDATGQKPNNKSSLHNTNDHE